MAWRKGVYLGPVHTYPDIFESATFTFRIQKFPRPHVISLVSAARVQ